MKYIQCKLLRGTASQTTWLPEKFAQVGKIVDLKDNETWSKGWKVEEAFLNSPLEEAYLRERSQDYKHTRKASDI